MTQSGFIKTACQNCEGRLELPVDAIGVDFACPRCSAKLTLALKCACTHCGGPLSFEREHIGRSTTCGHCGSVTPLMPSAIIADQPPQSTTSKPTPEPTPEPTQKAAETQLLPTGKAAETQLLPTKSTPERPAPPKRPAGAGGPKGPSAPAPRKPGGPGGSSAPKKPGLPPKRPGGAGGPGGPSAPAPRGPTPHKKPGGESAPNVPSKPSPPGAAPKLPGTPPKKPSAPITPDAESAKTTAETESIAVPEGVVLPGKAPSMPKMGEGNSNDAKAAPKRPASTSASPKAGGPMSPSAAAASRQSALAQSESHAKATAQAAAEVNASNLGKFKNQAGLAFFALTGLAGLAWYIVIPYLGYGGSDLVFKSPPPDSIAPVYRPEYDSSHITVDGNSLKIVAGDDGLPELRGTLRNDGGDPTRNIKLTLQITGGPQPITLTHTVNQEVTAAQAVEFKALLSFDPPANPIINVQKIETH